MEIWDGNTNMGMRIQIWIEMEIWNRMEIWEYEYGLGFKYRISRKALVKISQVSQNPF